MENFWMAITAIATATEAVIALLDYLNRREQGDGEAEESS